MQLPFLRPKTPAASARPPAGPDLEPGSVEAARTRARRRLVGALVLLVLGVSTFPLLFETQPRPISVDTPMTVAQRDGPQPAPARGATRPLVPLPVLPADAGIEQPAAPASETARGTPLAVAAVAAVTPTTVSALASAPAPTPAAAAAAAVAAKPAPALTTAKPTPVVVQPTPAKPKPTPPAVTPTEPSRPAGPAVVTAPAETTPPTATGRFVVQVGAFVEDRALREARQKVEKLGLKTYTQVIENDAGKRTRVRVGPFDTRAEADAAAAKLKAGGLPANILAL